MTLAKKIDSLIKELVVSSPDIIGAACVGMDGLVIASHMTGNDEIDLTRIGASIAAMYGMGKRTIEALNRGNLNELSLSGSKGSFFIYSAPKSNFIGVMAAPNANVGMINLLARNIVEKLAAIL